MSPHPSRSMMWALLESGGPSVLSLVVLFVIARVLGPTDLGTVALALGIAQIFSIVTDTLFLDAIVQRADLTNEHLDTAFWTCFVLGLLFALVVWFTSPLIGRLFDSPGLSPPLAVAGLNLSFSGVGSVAIAVLRRDFQFKALAMRSLYGRLLGAAIAILMVFLGFGVWSLIAQQLIQSAINSLFVWRATAWRPRFLFHFRRLRELLSFGLLAVGTRVVWLSSTKLLTILVGYFLGVTAVGYLNVGQRVVDTLHDMLAGAAYNLVLPMFSRLQANRPAMARAYDTATEFTGLLVQPLFGGVAICAASIVPLFLGQTWISAIPVIQILAIAAMFQFPLWFADAVIIALGRPGYIFIASLLGLGFVILSFVAFPPADVTSATVMWTCRILVMAPILLSLTNRLLGESPIDLLQRLWAPTLATLTMTMVLWQIQSQFLTELSPLETLLLQIPLGAALYVSAIALLKRSSLKRLLLFAASGIRGTGMSFSKE
jgi:O-antigen/teichoic acid export membrane protein